MNKKGPTFNPTEENLTLKNQLMLHINYTFYISIYIFTWLIQGGQPYMIEMWWSMIHVSINSLQI